MQDVTEAEMNAPWYQVTVYAKLKEGESIPGVIDIMTALSGIGFCQFDSIEVQVMKPKVKYYNHLPPNEIHDHCYDAGAEGI